MSESDSEEKWMPTMYLRWNVPMFAAASFTPYLEQKWTSDRGQETWRAIEEVETP